MALYLDNVQEEQIREILISARTVLEKCNNAKEEAGECDNALYIMDNAAVQLDKGLYFSTEQEREAYIKFFDSLKEYSN